MPDFTRRLFRHRAAQADNLPALPVFLDRPAAVSANLVRQPGSDLPRHPQTAAIVVRYGDGSYRFVADTEADWKSCYDLAGRTGGTIEGSDASVPAEAWEFARFWFGRQFVCEHCDDGRLEPGPGGYSRGLCPSCFRAAQLEHEHVGGHHKGGPVDGCPACQGYHGAGYTRAAG